nr:10124_t:CDS:2 [Entrophospora candida]
MEAIMKAEDQGFILEDDLIEAICSKQDDSLIDYNYLYCQPTRQFHCHRHQPKLQMSMLILDPSSIIYNNKINILILMTNAICESVILDKNPSKDVKVLDIHSEIGIDGVVEARN